ncbi:lens fiber membrane intrinsic protein [Plakobranchus ocellatus]|uniref:Lens fiber membrane intrinsic protein n=1 Tax=Plakobranchus ocellatus TaxID=259542 RepID=A0AAV4E0G1_9GAST|nr:lens fiber membrane intrinsic protein [Plakobranchus ocellatus]
MVKKTDVLGLTSLLVGIILVTITIPTYEWSNYERKLRGLWRFCHGHDRSCHDVYKTNAIRVVRSMVLLGDIVALIAVIVMLVSFVLKARRDISSRWTKPIVAGMSLVAGVFILAGVIVYSIAIDELQGIQDKRYSFWLAVAALIIMFISAFIFIVGMVMEKRKHCKLSRKMKELRERLPEENVSSKMASTEEGEPMCRAHIPETIIPWNTFKPKY